MIWSETNQLYLASENKISIIDPITLEEVYSKMVFIILLERLIN